MVEIKPINLVGSFGSVSCLLCCMGEICMQIVTKHLFFFFFLNSFTSWLWHISTFQFA